MPKDGPRNLPTDTACLCDISGLNELKFCQFHLSPYRLITYTLLAFFLAREGRKLGHLKSTLIG